MPESILVADGSQDCADAVAMMLASSGMRPTVAYDGQVAIALGTRERFDAAVMDLTMPGATGFTVAGELRRVHGESIKLIAYTAWPDSVAQKLQGPSTFDEVVSKSSEPWELLRAVSPECYGTFLRSMKASGERLRLEIGLANSLLDQAKFHRLPHRRAELHDLVSKRALFIEHSLRRLVITGERDALEARLDALLTRIRAECGDA